MNVDPRDSKIADPLERERLRRLFSGALGTPSGHVLPIQKANDGRWASSPWNFRDGTCFLVPGDSPVGLRLPLDSLPWVAPSDRPPPPDPDPGRPVVKLPTAKALLEAKPGPAAEPDTVTRTALVAEPRKGTLYVFMPPVDTLEDYLELVAAIEHAARATSTPVLLEGYGPPRDPRVVQFAVTPDPGVIEVNVQPSASWNDLTRLTTTLYEDARQERLVAEKFMHDGRHTGTGGGNHVVLGGATPADSPFLRRPDLLRSFIGYFHQHPSLSYLFSGMFIGPTSQSPRIDEARNDALYEMEIAFREVTRAAASGGAFPWVVDRIFRDLLADVTGNTHRAEFCIDKLFSPDGAAGRLGLLELRAFEMPPHARMSLAQSLLLRALVLRFWNAPYAPTRLARWGTELHDRFMLPHFVWEDFRDVTADLRANGIAVDPAWFLPHFEFRFPLIGDVDSPDAHGAALTFRTALEPWHVMAEDAAAGGTARYVDSSLERIEVKATGLADDRYRVMCNGRTVPLRATGVVGEAVAGVRFRAWQPPRCLHPRIGIHAPLTFDLVDTWSSRSVMGCEVHVVHPGGRNYETRPVNALEAEGRRRARFLRIGHTPGRLDAGPADVNEDFPFTLDLRRS